MVCDVDEKHGIFDNRFLPSSLRNISVKAVLVAVNSRT